jgi:hypothetical protein
MSVDVTASSGDVETVFLRRDGPSYTGTLFTTPAGPARKQNGSLSLIHGDFITVYYNDLDTGAGSKLIEKTVHASIGYTAFTSSPAPPFTFPNETATGLRASPATSLRREELPFAFPFFGKTYRQITIFPEGYVQFDTALDPNCLDGAGFANWTAIAPMGMWMRTNGNAQPNENIFLSRGPNSFTIRWAGETVPFIQAPPFTQTIEPVNFALTLFENGEVRFHYGAGNQNLVNRSPFAGCQGTTPVVGISRGIGNAAIAHPIGTERTSFAGTPVLGFVPPSGNASVPQLRLEFPGPDAKVSGVLAIRGIVYDSDTFVNAAHVLIDGVFRGNATRNQARADICNTERLPGCPNIGFTLNIDLKSAGIQPGAHTLQIRAVNAKGGFQDYPESPLTFTVEPSDGPLPAAAIESHKDGDQWRGNVTLRGYAYSKATRVTAVDVIVDGVAFTRAAYGLNRADLCAADAAGAPNCPGLGWQAVINTTANAPALPNGDHTVQLRITEDNGRLSFQPETPIKVSVDNPVNLPPTGVLTAPTNAQRVSGILTISGHAWDPDGRILSATIAIDGVQYNTLRYGLPRPEACASLENIAACPNIGFEGTFDTRRLANGNHRLAVILRDDSGRAVTIPGLTNAGINIAVDNP